MYIKYSVSWPWYTVHVTYMSHANLDIGDISAKESKCFWSIMAMDTRERIEKNVFTAVFKKKNAN